mgnify:FL=1
MPLPWRPEEGSVVRMFCHITHQDGTPFEYDSRALLEKAIKAASEEGLQFSFGTEQEFYLFRSDDFGEPTMIHMIMPDIWISLRKTKVKISDERSV